MIEAAPALEVAPTLKGYDPVCGMEVTAVRAAGRSDYNGLTYFFCSQECKRTFDSDPHTALEKMASRTGRQSQNGDPSVRRGPEAFTYS